MPFWQIRNVDESTITKVRVYAAQHQLTLAQALAKLVELALQK